MDCAALRVAEDLGPVKIEEMMIYSEPRSAHSIGKS
ncbi:hypothetical protein FKM82_009549 [Ascaphus truei]